MRRIAYAASLAAFITLAANAIAQQDVWEIDPAHSSAQFSVRHMMVSNVRGEFAKLSGKVWMGGKDFTKARVEATIDANSINTRNEGRDKHLRSADFFDVAKYPTIEFKSKKVESVASGRLRVIGDLIMHGATKEVALDVEGPTPEIKDKSGNTRMGVSASTQLNRKDFNLTWNSALDGGGVVVGDEVSITIDLELIKRASTGK